MTSPPSPVAPPSSDWRIWLGALLLVAIGIVAYANGVNNHFIGIDTLQNVRDNPDIRALQPLSRALSLHRVGPDAANDNSTLVRRPILSLSFALNYAATGPDAWGFQIVNIGLHIVAALLLFGIVRRTLALHAHGSPPHNCWVAFGVAAVWLAHPLNTESVTNIVQRAESLMGCFAFLTLYAALRAWRIPSAAPGARDSLGWSAVSVVACALGMGTKEIMVVVPFIVFLYDALFVSSGFGAALRRRWRFYLALAATWAVPAVLIALTLENTARELDPSRLGSYVLSQPRVILHYLRLAFWPHPLFHYIIGGPFWFHPGVDSWLEFLRSALPVGILLCLTIFAVWRRSPLGFLGAAFLLPLVPTSLLATFTLIQEHRTYLSLAAVVTAIVLAVDALVGLAARRFALQRSATAVRAALLVSALAALVYGTRLRNADYRSDLTLWAPDDLPLAFTMRTNLAIYHARLPEAVEVLDTLLGASTAALPGDPLFGYRARALNGLGTVRALQGQSDDAQQLFARSIAVDPTYAAAEHNLGVVLFQRGDRATATRHLERAGMLDAQRGGARYPYVELTPPEGRQLFPVPAWFSEERRHALAEADLRTAQFAVVVNPPMEEFSMDFTLALTSTGVPFEHR